MRRYRTATNDFENGRPKRDRAEWRFAVNSRHSEAEIDLMLRSSSFLNSAPSDTGDGRGWLRKTMRTTAFASSSPEVLLNLDDRLDAVFRFLLPVFLIEIKIEGTVADVARIWRIEIIR